MNLSPVLALAISLAAAAGDLVVLQQGQTIPLELAHYVNSAYNAPGSEVYFRTSEDVVVDGVTVIPKGQIVTGVVESAQRGRSFGRSGSIGLSVHGVEAVDGTIIPPENRPAEAHLK